MKTAHKIALARALYRSIHFARGVVGLSDTCSVERNGCNYELDLSEGIDLAVYLGVYERATSQALSLLIKPGQMVLDIGANIGIHTINMARLVGPKGRVVSFEPTDYAYKKLNTNMAANPALRDRITAVQCFLTSTDGIAAPEQIFSSWPLVGGANLHAKHLGQERKTAGVISISLDKYLERSGWPEISLVKMDVDGFECGVLAGSVQMMERSRPAFIMEMAPYLLEERGDSLEKFLSFFKPHGYRFFHESGECNIEISADKISSLSRDGASMNVVARVLA